LRPPENWKCVLLTTQLFAGAENTDSCRWKPPLNLSMVILPQPVIDIDDSNLFGNELAWGETIHFENLEFITDRFDNLSFSLEGNDSGAVFVGMAHGGSPSLHAVLEESTSEDDLTSSEGGSSSFPISQGYNVVTPAVPTAATPPPTS
jgi:hypothetical protein